MERWGRAATFYAGVLPARSRPNTAISPPTTVPTAVTHKDTSSLAKPYRAARGVSIKTAMPVYVCVPLGNILSSPSSMRSKGLPSLARRLFLADLSLLQGLKVVQIDQPSLIRLGGIKLAPSAKPFNLTLRILNQHSSRGHYPSLESISCDERA